MEIKRFFDPETDFTDLSSGVPAFFNGNGKSPDVHFAVNNGGSANSIGSCTGINPFPYIGDPPPPLSPVPVTIGTGTTTSYPFAPSTNIVQTYTPLPSALNDFFNIQYLSVEAVCAVTGKTLKPGEPVLILDEHIISKAAFMKLLREGFERLMVPKIEEMHEITGYDS